MKKQSQKISCNIEKYCDKKSFYKKASVSYSIIDNAYILKSYKTDVLSWNPKTNEIMCLWSGHSSTTQRHINAFLRMINAETGNNFETGKKALYKYPLFTGAARVPIIG